MTITCESQGRTESCWFFDSIQTPPKTVDVCLGTEIVCDMELLVIASR